MNIIGFIPILNKDLLRIKNNIVAKTIYDTMTNNSMLLDSFIITDNKDIYNECKKFGQVYLLKNKYYSDLDAIFSIIKNINNLDGFIYINQNEFFINNEHINEVCLGLKHGNLVTTLKYKTQLQKSINYDKIYCNKNDKVLLLTNNNLSSNIDYINIGIYSFDTKLRNKKIINNNLNINANNNSILNLIHNDIDIYAYTTKIPTTVIEQNTTENNIDDFKILQNNILKKRII